MTHWPSWARIGDGIVVSGRHFLLLSPVDKGMKELRSFMDAVFAPAYSFIATGVDALSRVKSTLIPLQSGEDVGARGNSASLLGFDLPVNVQLVSLERVAPATLLVRLSHQFDVDEDVLLSQPVTVDLFALLQQYKPIRATELTLSGNQARAERDAVKIQWKSESDESSPSSATSHKTVEIEVTARSLTETNSVVTLKALQIKTFSVDVEL